MPKISIIVPVHNTEPYLERCIERQATRLVSNEEISDEALKTLTIDDVRE